MRKIIKTLLLPALILVNFYFFHNSLIGLIVGFLYLFVYGEKLGDFFFYDSPKWHRRLFGGLLFLCLASIFGALAYYFYKINNAVFIVTLIGLPLAIEFCLPKKRRPFNSKTDQQHKADLIDNKTKWAAAALIFIYLAAAAACFYLLTKHGTTESIVAPWQVLSKKFFICFIAATSSLVALFLIGVHRRFSTLLAIIHTFLFSSVALFIYKLGFGYDPFVHLATMRHILRFGTITPTLYYYIGEYSLIIFLANLLQISLETINQILLPVLFSIFLPLSIASTDLATQLKRGNMLLIPCALFLPVTFFINTTPQGLACLLALIIILSEPQATTYNLLLSIAACFIHPFFGAPLLIYCLFRLGEQLNLKHRLKFFRRAATILPAAFIFPILFLINQLLTDKTIAFTWPHLSQIIRACHFNPAVAGEKSLTNYLFTLNHQSDFLYDLLYIYGFNYKIIFLIISLLGAILLLRKKNPPISKAPLLFAILFGFNYFVMKNFIDFKFLTEKEASDYLGRISELVFYFLLPTFLYFCARLFNGLLHNNKIVAQQNVIPSEVDGAVEGYVWHLWINRLFIIFLLTTTSVASLYLSYPVFDSYKNSKFINMSKNDIAAVKAISADAEAKYNLGATNGHPEALEGRHYIVLANQMVAAAALNEFGFAKYFGEEYFYSIPNANPDGFYQYFLSMMEDDPTRETAAAAMKSAGVDQLYFVANTYWRNSAAIIKKAKTTANRWKSINNKVFIFYYSN